MPTLRADPRESVKIWFDNALASAAKGTVLPWAIVDVASGEAVGARLISTSRWRQAREIGSTWQRGGVGSAINTECKFLLLRTRSRRSTATGAVENRSAQRPLAKPIARLGAVREGVLRAQMVMPDGWVRDREFSILKAEWPAVKRPEAKMARERVGSGCGVHRSFRFCGGTPQPLSSAEPPHSLTRHLRFERLSPRPLGLEDRKHHGVANPAIRHHICARSTPSRTAPSARWRFASDVALIGFQLHAVAVERLERVAQQEKLALGLIAEATPPSRATSNDLDALVGHRDVEISRAADRLAARDVDDRPRQHGAFGRTRQRVVEPYFHRFARVGRSVGIQRQISASAPWRTSDGKCFSASGSSARAAGECDGRKCHGVKRSAIRRLSRRRCNEKLAGCLPHPAPIFAATLLAIALTSGFSTTSLRAKPRKHRSPRPPRCIAFTPRRSNTARHSKNLRALVTTAPAASPAPLPTPARSRGGRRPSVR